MNHIYRVTIQGRTFESRDIRRLLARAVNEKRSLDRRIRVFAGRGLQGDSTFGAVSQEAACGAVG